MENMNNIAFNIGKLDSLVIEIAKVLAYQCINFDEPIITYGDLANKLSEPINPRNLDHPLGQLSVFCRLNDMPLLSVIVVNSDTYRPGSGFFKYFFPQAKSSDWDEIYIKQLNLVKEYKWWGKFIN